MPLDVLIPSFQFLIIYHQFEVSVMVYKILCAADFHWGAMDPDKQYEENKFIIL